MGTRLQSCHEQVVRSGGPTLTETIKDETLTQTLEKHFPKDRKEENRPRDGRIQPEGDLDFRAKITEKETIKAIKRRAQSITAPGMDGISMQVVKEMPQEGIKTLTRIYNRCCDDEYFPKRWRRAMLVLIPKEMPVDQLNPKVRPICLLDEIGKILETILVDRIRAWMRDNPAARWSRDQYGFNEGTSTTDALMTVYNYIQEANSQGRIVVAASLDIQNAFNSLPWE